MLPGLGSFLECGASLKIHYTVHEQFLGVYFSTPSQRSVWFKKMMGCQHALADSVVVLDDETSCAWNLVALGGCWFVVYAPLLQDRDLGWIATLVAIELVLQVFLRYPNSGWLCHDRIRREEIG